MTIKDGASYRDRPQHERTEASKRFEAELDAELLRVENEKLRKENSALQHQIDLIVENDTATDAINGKLRELVRDMWEFGESSPFPYTPLESVRWAQMREEYQERIAALVTEVDE